jgi:hypothetical protein
VVGPQFEVTYPRNESIWNCEEVYAHHQIKKGAPQIPWASRLHKYLGLRKLVIDSLHESLPVYDNAIGIIDRRKGDRKFPAPLLQRIRSALKKLPGWYVSNVIYFEDMDFLAQVKFIRRHRVLVMRHGAGESNMLFARPGSFLVEMNTAAEITDARAQMYDQIVRVSNCTHANINIDTAEVRAQYVDGVHVQGKWKGPSWAKYKSVVRELQAATISIRTPFLSFLCSFFLLIEC